MNRGSKIKGSHISLTQNSMLNSVRQQNHRMHSINSYLKDQYSNMKKREKIALVKRNINSLRGRHHSINYKEQYDFNEKWQGQSQSQTKNKKGNIEFLKNQKQQTKYLKYANILIYLSNYWIISIYRTFSIQQYLYVIIPVILISQVLDVIIKSETKENQINDFNNHQKQEQMILFFLKKYWITILLGLYIIVLVIQNNNFSKTLNMLMTFVDLFVAAVCYVRFSELYSDIKIQILSSKYRNELNLTQLFGKCCKIVHLSSIALMLSSFVNNQLNWTLNIDHFNQSWYAKYIYSIYFSCTTVFTVGYGDITPKNLLQIVVVLLIQVIGVINLGYIFSEIGRILAKFNEEEENLIKNMYHSEKIAQTYNLPSSLAGQMKQQIINHDLAKQKLNTHEQQKLLRMINDDLRNKIIFVNQIHIIKHSIFFICNWTAKFQMKIANKLVMQTFRPEEPLSQIKGQQKLYILTQGKVHIRPCLFNKVNQIIYRPIHKVQFNEKNLVHFNTFGYSFLISGLNIKLKAIAKDYSICYLITKQDFVNLMSQDEKDFQYFHEIKNRIETSFTKQVWQAPKLVDNRQHYRPNIYYLVKKYRKQMVEKQSRKYVIRRTNKLNFCIEDEEFSDQITKQNLTQAEIEEVIERNILLTDKQRRNKYDSICSKNNLMITLRSYKKKSSIKKMTTIQMQINTKHLFKFEQLNNFDSGKCFTSYFKKHNPNHMIAKYNILFSKNKQTVSIRSISTIRSLDGRLYSLNQVIVDKLLKIRVLEK